MQAMSRNGVPQTRHRVEKTSIVDEQRFILSTRDTGYRSTASAVAELVDNSVQAGAKWIRIFVNQEGVGVDRRVQLAVLDNGCGMDSSTLATALRFGGSSRFDDRTGPGRFGMGLPNCSVSQALRLEVFTWTRQNQVRFSYLDVGEIADGNMAGIPAPRPASLPDWTKKYVRGNTGTLVLWDQCDRLDFRKASTITTKLHNSLGRKFRYFLWDGVKIFVNDEPVLPTDPLCLQIGGEPLAIPYGEPLTYEVRVPGNPTRTSTVKVRFSELQVAKLHNLSVEEKRQLGIAKGAGVSIVRANREIDYGWYFMGNKRKENYDDWWRCEILFDPPLDELFGVTHSKQEVHPKDDIFTILVPDLEATAHTLNSRVRAAFTLVRTMEETRPATAADVATEKERVLSPVSKSEEAPTINGSHTSGNGRPTLHGTKAGKKPSATEQKERRYKFDTAALRGPEFYSWQDGPDGTVYVTLNTKHPFYDEVYQKLCTVPEAKFALECLLLASVRADMVTGNAAEKDWNKRRLVSLSNALAAYLEQ
jgi:hypothetical protein